MTEETNVDILLVEDSPTDAELVIRTLEKCDCTQKVHVVKDGTEAIHFLTGKGPYEGRKGTCKVMILDLKLLKLNGQDVLREVKSNEDTKKVPIVVFSSSRQDKDLVESYALGANSYIAKPVDSGEFNETVKEICRYWVKLNKTAQGGIDGR